MSPEIPQRSEEEIADLDRQREAYAEEIKHETATNYGGVELTPEERMLADAELEQELKKELELPEDMKNWKEEDTVNYKRGLEFSYGDASRGTKKSTLRISGNEKGSLGSGKYEHRTKAALEGIIDGHKVQITWNGFLNPDKSVGNPVYLEDRNWASATVDGTPIPNKDAIELYRKYHKAADWRKGKVERFPAERDMSNAVDEASEMNKKMDDEKKQKAAMEAVAGMLGEESPEKN